MSNLSISNVVNISVATPPSGLAAFQVNNLLIVTKETPLNTLSAGYGIYMSPAAVAVDWGSGSDAYAQAVAIYAQSPNILSAGGVLIIAPFNTGEALTDVILRVSGLIYFGGVLFAGYAPTNSEILTAGALVQTMTTLLFAPAYQSTDLQSGGLIPSITSGKLTRTRGLFYSVSAAASRVFAAGYASRLMSTDFTGTRTTGTMHMKDLNGIAVDSALTQTMVTTASTAGADVYGQIGGLSKVFSFGTNDFSDNIWNLNWLVGALQVAGFNAIATTATKIPQTENGMAQLKSAYIAVLAQAVNNGYVAPGTWNSTELFGDPDSLRRNVTQAGYYIYSQPVSAQLQSDRAARKAPLIQVAIKLAGAVHSTTLVVNINA